MSFTTRPAGTVRPGDFVRLDVNPAGEPHEPLWVDEGFVGTISEEGLALVTTMDAGDAEWWPADRCTVLRRGPFHIVAKSVTIGRSS